MNVAIVFLACPKRLDGVLLARSNSKNPSQGDIEETMGSTIPYCTLSDKISNSKSLISNMMEVYNSLRTPETILG
jgi:hypothetical protein